VFSRADAGLVVRDMADGRHTGKAEHPLSHRRAQCDDTGCLAVLPPQVLDRRPASQRSRLPAPIAAKARAVLVDQRLGTDDGQNLKDRRKPAVKHDQQPAILVREPDTALEPAPQNSQLMPKYRVLSLKPHLRLDWRGQDSQDETQKPIIPPAQAIPLRHQLG
jgi:hypothetical protein